MKKIKINSIDRNKPHHVSLDVILEFIDTLLKDQDVEVYRQNAFFSNNFIKATVKRNIPILNTLITNISDRLVFSVAMGISGLMDIVEHKMAKRKALFLFDAWPSQYEQIQRFINTNKTNLLFVTSKQSTEELAKKLHNCKVIWCPEGCNINNYKRTSYIDRNIDILALGRKYEFLHKKIIESDIPLKYSYLYELNPGEIIFPSYIDFIKGLASSKIIICYPKSITHPISSGRVETMTNRYLQGIASKVLLVGYCPKEMYELFGYNPVIDLDNINPVPHLKSIIENFENYIPLIEKNYITLKDNHQWENRWNFIKNQLLNNLN